MEKMELTSEIQKDKKDLLQRIFKLNAERKRKILMILTQKIISEEMPEEIVENEIREKINVINNTQYLADIRRQCENVDDIDIKKTLTMDRDLKSE